MIVKISNARISSSLMKLPNKEVCSKDKLLDPWWSHLWALWSVNPSLNFMQEITHVQRIVWSTLLGGVDRISSGISNNRQMITGCGMCALHSASAFEPQNLINGPNKHDDSFDDGQDFGQDFPLFLLLRDKQDSSTADKIPYGWLSPSNRENRSNLCVPGSPSSEMLQRFVRHSARG